MSVILSCGHREDNFDKHFPVMTKEWDITEDGWTKAVGYSTVCLHCFERYEMQGAVLYTEDEAMEWLRSNDEAVGDRQGDETYQKEST